MEIKYSKKMQQLTVIQTPLLNTSLLKKCDTTKIRPREISGNIN